MNLTSLLTALAFAAAAEAQLVPPCEGCAPGTADRSVRLLQTFYDDARCSAPSNRSPVEHVVPPTQRCRAIEGGGSVQREPHGHASIVPSHLDIPAKVWEFDRYPAPFVSSTPWGWDYGPIDRSVSVFDGVITVYADVNIPDSELQHVASVVAEFLDNNEDGTIENLAVAETLRRQQATLIVHHQRTPGERTGQEPRNDVFLSLGTDAIQTLESKIDKDWLTPNPDFVDNLGPAQSSGEYDPTLEEVWHLITDHGYGKTYPAVWSRDPEAASSVQALMDVARGGRFDAEPDAALPEDAYPAGAWFTREQGCWYGCFVAEYLHWAWSTLAGAQRYRQDQDYQWKLFTPAEMFATDHGATALLKDCRYRAPRNLPNGKYTVSATGHGRQFEFCAEGPEADAPSDPVLFLRTFASPDCSGPPTSPNTTIVVGACAPSAAHAGMFEEYAHVNPNDDGGDTGGGGKTCKQRKNKCPKSTKGSKVKGLGGDVQETRDTQAHAMQKNPFEV